MFLCAILMNGSVFIIALVIAGFYLFLKFMEMRFVLKENKPLKLLLRDAILVYLSVVGGNFILEQVEPLKHMSSSPDVFTTPPDF